ncbi:MAG: S-methyl-5'-thioadenosine phosphorylase [Oceanicola sp.]|nr:S-methyl-5'-thioadenosine phosphorylase [Oceanicola sp.]
MTKVGIIGGSGVYEVDGLTDARWITVDTPWGAPSDQLLTGRLQGLEMVFLPRHGRGHVHSPTSVPYRANIDALKRLGVTDVIAFSACGSFRQEMAPGDFVMVDQFIDRTRHRESSFFGTGCVAHVSLADPTCPRLSAQVGDAIEAAGVRVHRGGTYLAMEGPQFSTKAESTLYRGAFDCDVIGMTNMPEAKLAREAELCYCPVAMVTDYDCWHPEHASVDVAQVVEVMQHNAKAAKETVKALPSLPLAQPRGPCPHGCDRALDTALITAPAARDPALLARLDAIAGRVLNS